GNPAGAADKPVHHAGSDPDNLGGRLLPWRDCRDALFRNYLDARPGADLERHWSANRRGSSTGYDEATRGAAANAQLLRVHPLNFAYRYPLALLPNVRCGSEQGAFLIRMVRRCI